MIPRRLSHFGTLLALTLALTACNNSGGGGGGGGATAQNACTYGTPSDLDGLSGSLLIQAEAGISKAFVTQDHRFVLPYLVTFGQYSALIWNGSSWANKGVTPSGYSLLYNDIGFFEYGGQIVAIALTSTRLRTPAVCRPPSCPRR
jgi:hypothetical protein